MSKGRHKPKGLKRRKNWHRGKGEARRWQRTELPDVGSGADPTTGAPTPLRRDGGPSKLHGDCA